MVYIRYKKIILAVILTITFAAGYWMLIYKKDGPAYEKKAAELSLIKPSSAKELNLDSDNDGLKNWEESLWKTDPNNPDTDADGILDGEEIKQNTNPLGQGALHKTDFLKTGGQELQAANTLTTALGRRLFNDLNLNQKIKSGAPLTKDDQKKLVSTIINDLDDFYEKEDNSYKIEDIKTLASNEKESVKNYGNQFGRIIKKYFDPLPETELYILNQALANQDASQLEKLGPLALAYKNTAEESLNLLVPQELAQDHLAVLNSFIQISKEIENMKKALADPMLVLVAFKQHMESTQKAYSALKNINNYFLKREIIFEETEPGNLWSNYI